MSVVALAAQLVRAQLVGRRRRLRGARSTDGFITAERDLVARPRGVATTWSTGTSTTIDDDVPGRPVKVLFPPSTSTFTTIGDDVPGRPVKVLFPPSTSTFTLTDHGLPGRPADVLGAQLVVAIWRVGGGRGLPMIVGVTTTAWAVCATAAAPRSPRLRRRVVIG